MMAIELTQPIPDVPADRIRRSPHGRITVLVRLHGHPIGRVELSPPARGLPAAELAAVVAAELPEIRCHLVADGLPVPEALGRDGLGPPPAPTACLARRRAALQDPPFITVLVATRDRTASLLRCLHSISALDYSAFEIVVVDSAPSSDETAAAMAETGGWLGPAPVRYIREPRPGLAVAHNRGLAVARGAWVAITDDDVVVDPQWLAAIAESTTASPGVACVTGLILPAELETEAQVLLEQYGGFARGFVPRLYDTGVHRPDDPLFPIAAGRLGSGANMAFATDVLRKLGGFDAAVGAGTPARGGDDLVGFLRVLRNGYTLAYQPAAIVWHHHRREYAGLLRQARHYGVGLGAYLTSAVVHDPALLATMVRRVGPGLRHFLDRGSAKNAGKPAGFPRQLERAERMGVLQGPFSYAFSRWRNHRALTS